MSDGAQAIGTGKALAEARQQLGLGEEDVADALNLPARVIADLEAESWDDLPAPAFTRGYIRAYAKLLELDSDALVASYESLAGAADTVEIELPVAARAGVGEVLQRQPNSVLSGAAVAVVVVLGAILWAVWPDTPEQPAIISVDPGGDLALAENTETIAARADAPAESTAQSPVARAVESVSRDSAEPESAEPETAEPVSAVSRVADAPDAADVTAPAADTQIADTVAAEIQVDTDDADTDDADTGTGSGPRAFGADATPRGTARLRQLTDPGSDRVTLEFTADCWVEVRDAAGSTLYGDLSRAGDALDLRAERPLRVLLGYAPGVALAFNGEPVDLARYTRNNVAALWLGR